MYNLCATVQCARFNLARKFRREYIMTRRKDPLMYQAKIKLVQGNTCQLIAEFSFWCCYFIVGIFCVS